MDGDLETFSAEELRRLNLNIWNWSWKLSLGLTADTYIVILHLDFIYIDWKDLLFSTCHPISSVRDRKAVWFIWLLMPGRLASLRAFAISMWLNSVCFSTGVLELWTCSCSMRFDQTWLSHAAERRHSYCAGRYFILCRYRQVTLIKSRIWHIQDVVISS